MYSNTYLVPLLSAFTLTLAAPSIIVARASTCDQFTPVQSGAYAVQNDAWGESSGSGSQCAQIDSLNGNSLAWSTTFSWSGGGDSIKTYANVEAASNTPCKALSQYKSIPTKWDWSYSTSITGDVSYDAFLGSQCDGPGDPHTYEVMIWLAQLGGLDPIGTVQTTAQVGNSSFKLWKGPNTSTGATVFSFVATSTTNSFKGDLMDFFNYLVKNDGVDASLLLTSVQAGTEVAAGTSAKFTTSSYTISSS